MRAFFIRNFGTKNYKAAQSAFVQNFGAINVLSYKKRARKMLMKLTLGMRAQPRAFSGIPSEHNQRAWSSLQ
jgi:hypothetical protein